MAKVEFAEFSENLARIFDQVLSEGEPVVLEKEAGRLVEVKPVIAVTSRRRSVTQADEAALRTAAFGWAEIDIDTYRHDLAESRRGHSRTLDE